MRGILSFALLALGTTTAGGSIDSGMQGNQHGATAARHTRDDASEFRDHC
jgi:hypothetical protein